MTSLQRRTILFFLFVVTILSHACKYHAVRPEIKQASAHHIFVDSFPPPTGYVNDYENIFSTSEENILDTLMSEIEKVDGMQIAVISFDTSMITRDSLDAVTLRVANGWGVGQKYKNNGITIGMCMGYRKIRIQNGLGIEKWLSNDETKHIIDSVFIPAFSNTQFFRGTYDGINALVSRFRDNQLFQKNK